MHILIITVINLLVYVNHNPKTFVIIHYFFNKAKIHCKNKGQAIVLVVFEILVFVAIFIFCSVGNVEIQ